MPESWLAFINSILFIVIAKWSKNPFAYMNKDIIGWLQYQF